MPCQTIGPLEIGFAPSACFYVLVAAHISKKRTRTKAFCILDLERTPSCRMGMMDTKLTVQQMAAATGLSGDTLRYYEKIGLIDPVERAANGHRRYSQEAHKRPNYL